MSAAHDDRGPSEQKPSTDVSEAEADAIASTTSAVEVDDVGLVAPTTHTSDISPSTAPGADAADETRGRDDAEGDPSEDDRRRMQQGSGQASPSFGEQQQRVPPTP